MYNYILPIGSLLASFIALYFTLKKQGCEVDNIDADTIAKLYSTIKEQEYRYTRLEERYTKLQTEFDNYKKVMSDQMSYLQSEATRWRSWGEKLNKQLKDNNIQPENF